MAHGAAGSPAGDDDAVIYRVLADLVVGLHAGFVLFVLLGGLVVLRWRRVVWVHLPCVAWAVAIELGGWICPLTPLENRLRTAAGQAGYEGGFIEHYLIPVLYPDTLTRSMQAGLALLALSVNVVVYLWVLSRRRGRR
jgi:hypothetical protein